MPKLKLVRIPCVYCNFQLIPKTSEVKCSQSEEKHILDVGHICIGQTCVEHTRGYYMKAN